MSKTTADLPNFRGAVCCDSCCHFNRHYEGEGECKHPSIVTVSSFDSKPKNGVLSDGTPAIVVITTTYYNGVEVYCSDVCDLHEEGAYSHEQEYKTKKEARRI